MNDTVCIICNKPIKWNGLLWVEVDNVPFPQYCVDEFQNEGRSQLHIPKEVK